MIGNLLRALFATPAPAEPEPVDEAAEPDYPERPSLLKTAVGITTAMVGAGLLYGLVSDWANYVTGQQSLAHALALANRDAQLQLDGLRRATRIESRRRLGVLREAAGEAAAAERKQLRAERDQADEAT